ncbi:Protein EDS1L [Linum grandiflorum]
MTETNHHSFFSRCLRRFFSFCNEGGELEKMGSVNLVDNLNVRAELVKKASSLAVKPHKSQQLFLSEKSRGSPEVIFSFPGSWNLEDWISKPPFGEAEVDLQLFPSLLYIGLREPASVNEAFLRRFTAVLAPQHQFVTEVEKAMKENKQVVFTGHSLGGPIAILATIWFLEKYVKSEKRPNKPLCLTFGSPLVGDRFLNHALKRENWSQLFIHFVMRYDIVPRISLTPISSPADQRLLQVALNFFNPKSPQNPSPADAQSLYVNVVRSSSSVASHAACKIMGNTNLLLETVSGFVQLSPYRPFGTYVFATGNGKLVILRNPDAVLQVLFYSSQLKSPEEVVEVAARSLKDHLGYKDELKECLEMQSVTCLDHDSLANLPLSSDSTTPENATVNAALNDLGLSVRGRLCLRAAAELEKQKSRNQATIEGKVKDIEKGIQKLEDYKNKCARRDRTYYGAFRMSEDKSDFEANVTRLELAGIWDEIIEMLKRYELPDEFEGNEEWIKLGTRFRVLTEPLDIANYYRHSKNEDTGPYMGRGRPKRYKCTQRWKEHFERVSMDPPDSCLWAEVEELLIAPKNPVTAQLVKTLKRKVEEYKMQSDVGLEDSMFLKLLKMHNIPFP